jgi:hypothetical protein
VDEGKQGDTVIKKTKGDMGYKLGWGFLRKWHAV